MVTENPGVGRWQPWALRAAVFGIPVGLFAALRPGPFRAAITSPAALVRILALTVVLTGVCRLVRRLVDNRAVRAAVPAVVALAVLAVVVRPYFSDETVVETLPTSAADLGIAAPAAAVVPAPAADVAPAAATSTTVPVTVPPAPVRLTAGALRGIDHRASGAAALYGLADGTAVVRLEDIDIQNGPDYDVYLVPGADRRALGAGVDLGALKGNQGTQHYAVPAGIDVQSPHTVLIWCRTFAVPVANATQAAVS